MNEEELLEEAELADGDVGRPSGLQALVTRDTNADVRRLDHRDVVSAVADGEEDGLEVLLDELDDERLLQR